MPMEHLVPNFRHAFNNITKKQSDVMKRLHTLCLALFCLSVSTLTFIPATTAQTSGNQKVVVIKKKTDSNGQQTIESHIVTDAAEADNMINEIQADAIIYEAEGTHPCVNLAQTKCDKVYTTTINKNLVVDVNDDNGEKVVVINVDGETETIRLAKGKELSAEDKERLAAKGMVINSENGTTWVRGPVDVNFDFDLDLNLSGLSENLVDLGKGLTHLGDLHHVVAYAGDNINCAALGVYVSSNSPTGVYVNSIIGKSGAEEAGLQSGDVISSIDEYPTTQYGLLHAALSNYEPGDVVTVTYVRDGKEDRVEVQLRAWKEFPAFANSRHALITCGQDVKEEVVSRKVIVIKKDKVEEPVQENVNQSPSFIPDNTLEIADFTAFPNPTDGKFNVQFTAEAVEAI
jgi:PDZ domain-containing secreted protein